MIWTPYTAIMFILSLFAIALTAYAVPKAWRIWRRAEKASLEERYELEKAFYLASTVVWLIIISRIVGMGLYWVANESLIPLVPGAMCQWGIHQAGHPFSWIDSIVKLIVIFVYGIWLSLDMVNRRCKGAPLMGTLSKYFVFLMPLLIVDAGLDLAFYLKVEPVTVPCCRVVFTAENPLPCPFCFVFHDAPMFIAVIVGYGMAIATMIWGSVVKKYASEPGDLGEVSMKALRLLANLSLFFAIIGTIALIPAIFQIMVPAAVH
ncbi:MAG: hypothetical protein ACXQTF_01090 [Candidatus Hecatellaceae archaeon]